MGRALARGDSEHGHDVRIGSRKAELAGPPTMFIGGNDECAKDTVTQLLVDTGWDVADLGGIEVSRYLEPDVYGLGPLRHGQSHVGHAFRLLRG